MFDINNQAYFVLIKNRPEFNDDKDKPNPWIDSMRNWQSIIGNHGKALLITKPKITENKNIIKRR